MSNVLYDLKKTQTIFREKTKISYYYSPREAFVKKTKPVTIDGVRYKQNLETGEVTTYTKQEYDSAQHCSVGRTKRMVDILLEMNEFDWFATLTFDGSRYKRFDDEVVYGLFRKYINNMSHQFPNLEYICFPERHKDNAIHFHMLIGGVTSRQLGLENSGKVCCHWATRKNGICSRSYFEQTKSQHILNETDGLPVYNATKFTYGYTTVTRIASRERCNFYVKKYVEKALGSTEIFKKRFYYSKNLKVPEIISTIIGHGFTTPKQIDLSPEVLDDALYQASRKLFKNDYNVLQVEISNDARENISRGLIPLNPYQEQELALLEELAEEQELDIIEELVEQKQQIDRQVCLEDIF